LKDFQNEFEFRWNWHLLLLSCSFVVTIISSPSLLVVHSRCWSCVFFSPIQLYAWSFIFRPLCAYWIFLAGYPAYPTFRTDCLFCSNTWGNVIIDPTMCSVPDWWSFSYPSVLVSVYVLVPLWSSLIFLVWLTSSSNSQFLS